MLDSSRQKIDGKEWIIIGISVFIALLIMEIYGYYILTHCHYTLKNCGNETFLEFIWRVIKNARF